MPIIVQFKERIGHCFVKNNDGSKSKLFFCKANCLCALIYFTKEDGEEMAYLSGFFHDQKHAKGCIENGFFEHFTNFHFKAEMLKDNKELWGLVMLITSVGKKVTIE